MAVPLIPADSVTCAGRCEIPGVQQVVTSADHKNNVLVAGIDGFNDMKGGNDWVSGGNGRDGITTGAGADLIEGGADGQSEKIVNGNPVLESGGDIVDGGAGDDEIYGNSKLALNPDPNLALTPYALLDFSRVACIESSWPAGILKSEESSS